MYNSQLIKILKTLPKNELRELGKFVNAPCFNTRTDVIELFEYLAKYHGEPPTVFEKEKIFATLFSNKKYDDVLMRFLIHQLLKIIKTYFIQKELETDEVEMQIILARAMRRRGFDDFFEKEIDIAHKLNAQNTHRNASFYFKNYQIQSEQLKYITAKSRKGYMPYKEITESLNHFFTTEVLRHACETQFYKAVIGKDVQIDFLTETLAWFEREERLTSSDNLSATVYYNTYMMFQTLDNQYFERLKNLIQSQNDYFNMEEINFIYSATMNFCAKKINAGESAYLDEVFELMQLGLEQNMFLENGFLSKFIFKNVVTTGLRLEKYDWVRDFIETSKQRLHPKDREVVYNYNLAVYYFRKGDYAQAMPLLQRRDFGDVLTDLAARALLLRIYYDTEAYDALMSLTDSFQTFLNRQKELNYQKDNYLNLIRIVKKMLRADLRNAETRKQLLDEVQQTQYLAEKNWLVERLA